MRIRLSAPATAATVVADQAGRRITGMLIPYGAEGQPSVGPARITVAADAAITITDGMVLNLEHDEHRPIGRLVGTIPSDSGLVAEFRVVATSAGTDALTEAAEGLRSGLSIEAQDVEGHDIGGLFHITAATITEAALVRRPAFAEAAVTEVAATAANNEGNPMENTTAVAEQTAPEVQAAETTPIPTPTLHLSERLPSPADYMRAMLNPDLAPQRAAMTRQIRAAAPHTFVADIPGLIPEPLVGPVISLAPESGQLYQALGMYRAASKKFDLQMISPNLPAAGTGEEKSDITEQLGVIEVPVELEFIKIAANLSAEAVSASNNDLINVTLAEIASAMLAGIEKSAVVPKVEGATGTNAAVAIAANGSDAWAKLAAAQAAHYKACGKRADLFVCAPDVWGKLAGFTNLVSAPLVVGIDQSLTGGWGTLFGVPIVVSPDMTAGKAFLLSKYGVKSWNLAQIDMRVTEATIQGYALSSGQYAGVSIASGKFITPVTVAST